MTTASLFLAALSLSVPTQSASQGEFAWGDVDADGLLDLVVVVEGTPRLYHNAGGGAFSERSAELGLAGIDDALFGLWRDLDGDRYPELLIDEKAALLSGLEERRGRLFFTHDPEVALARVVRDDRGRFKGHDVQETLQGTTR